MQVVLFGVGSPIVAEYVETCRRLDWSIVAAIQNHDGELHFKDLSKIVKVTARKIGRFKPCSILGHGAIRPHYGGSVASLEVDARRARCLPEGSGAPALIDAFAAIRDTPPSREEAHGHAAAAARHAGHSGRLRLA
jgi:hypothetical protein